MKFLNLLVFICLFSVNITAQSTQNKIKLSGTYYAKVNEGVKYIETEEYITFDSKSDGYVKFVSSYQSEKVECECSQFASFSYLIKKVEIIFNYSDFTKQTKIINGDYLYHSICDHSCNQSYKKMYKNKIWVLNSYQIQIGGVVYTKIK